MEYRVLGPLEVVRRGRPVPLCGSKQRSLLACLLLEANRVVSTDRLRDEVWPVRAPESAAHALQVYVCELRKRLGATRIVTHPSGYRMQIDDEELDVVLFDRLADEGGRALRRGQADRASRVLRDALSLWRGPALDGLPVGCATQAELARLEELRLVAVEQRIQAELLLGHDANLACELEALVARQPLRERLRAQLMLALYRSGRQAEALDVYRDTRATLVDELGLEPCSELRELQRRILAQDPRLGGAGPRRRLRL